MVIAVSVILSIVAEYYLLENALHGSLIAGAVVVIAEFVVTIVAALYFFSRKTSQETIP